MSNGVGYAAFLDFLDDGGQASILDALAANDFESENGGRCRVRHGRLLEIANGGSDSSRRHVLGQDHSAYHFGAVAIRLPGYRMLRE